MYICIYVHIHVYLLRLLALLQRCQVRLLWASNLTDCSISSAYRGKWLQFNSYTCVPVCMYVHICIFIIWLVRDLAANHGLGIAGRLVASITTTHHLIHFACVEWPCGAAISPSPFLRVSFSLPLPLPFPFPSPLPSSFHMAQFVAKIIA